MSIHLDVGNLKELARATQKAVLSLSPSDQDAAIQTISARILGTEHPVGSASHPRAVVPPPELTEEEEEILAQHLELLKGVKWAKIEREIGKYVPDPEPELRAKNFKAGAWFIKQGDDPGTYVVMQKLSGGDIQPSVLTEESLITKGFSLEGLHLQAKDYAGSKPWTIAGYTVTAKKIAALAIGALAVGATAFLLSRGGAPAAEPQGLKLQPVPQPAPQSVPQLIPQRHVWQDWTYAPAEELPASRSQICDLSQQIWKNITQAQESADLPEWAINRFPVANSYTSHPPDDQVHEASECLARIKKCNSKTKTLTLHRLLNEVAMRGEALDPFAHSVKDGFETQQKLSQAQVDIGTELVQRHLQEAKKPKDDKQPPLAEIPKMLSYRNKQLKEARKLADRYVSVEGFKKFKDDSERIERELNAWGKSQLNRAKEALTTRSHEIRAKYETLLKGEKQPTIQEIQPLLDEIDALEKELEEAAPILGGSQLKSSRDSIADIHINTINRAFQIRSDAIREKYDALLSKGKAPSIEEIGPFLNEIGTLKKELSKETRKFSTAALKPSWDGITDIQRTIMGERHSQFRLKSIDQMVRSAGSLSTNPQAAAEPNTYLTQQKASEQSVPKQTPLDTLFHDSVALQGQLDSCIRQTTKLLEQTEPLTIDIVDRQHMKVAAKLSELEKGVETHYEGIQSKKSNDLSLADPPGNQASFDKAIALTRIGLAKSVIQQLTSGKTTSAEKRVVTERANALLNEAEAAVQANVREQDRDPLLRSIQELRGQIPKLGIWDYAFGKRW